MDMPDIDSCVMEGHFTRTDLEKALRDALAAMVASVAEHPSYTRDPLRRAALVVEEAGEALQEALDLTRTTTPPEPALTLRTRLRLYRELSHTASMALKAMAAMNADHRHGWHNEG